MIEVMVLMKSVFTLFVSVLVVVYWKYYGPQNFLWMSDVGLFLTLAAVWLESPLIISVCICAFVFVELAWNLDFLIELATGRSLLGLAHYMFQPRHSLFLRLLSLFHVMLPVIWFWLILVWGYDTRALLYAVPLIWLIFITTYWCTDPELNINWIFMPALYHWKRVSVVTWFLLLLIGYPLLVCCTTHMICVYLL
jgi:hypothetical protein